MNDDFYDNDAHSGARGDDRFSSQRPSGATSHGAGYIRRKAFDFWTAAEILAHRWHWPIVCGILAAGAFFTLAWFKLLPKYTAVTELMRYETPGTSEFLKTSPLTSQTF